ncbi:uncharacterized protein HD556DRAFT_1448855 [Suillus plorans]|uniref:Uncharacterized protein n=1 Tax=Suillus plorans TaxID=116603 RepID=A0A9P7ADW1_9AGAM|nr:uncharacterized protein HD556DRAFT_1448855 [Suillus plorans]KAG1787365.1 hypothetical protein HD556DRAFT_1448855 [Suillus plorans]
MDLIFERTTKYPNWDPPAEIPLYVDVEQVGSYGKIDKATGNFIPQGSIYSNDFQSLLRRDCPEESEFTAWSKNVRRLELNVESHAGVPGIATATIKGTWQFRRGTTGSILIMNKPRIKTITQDVLGKLSNIEFLKSVHLVIKVFHCPAYTLYLSDKSGENINIALLSSAPVLVPLATVGATVEVKRWSDAQAGLTRSGSMPDHCFTPLYELKHPRYSRASRRSSISPERTGEELWVTSNLPWASLDEDGQEPPVFIDNNPDSSDSEEESGL